jgi:hypothetical protein
MGAGHPILFFVDEGLPDRLIRGILAGHAIQQVQISAKDQEILESAEQQSAIVMTPDAWFLKELYRFPWGHQRCRRRAGVVQLPGEWDRAQRRLTHYLPVIEAVCRLNAARPEDRRVGIDLSQREIRIFDSWT